MVIRKIIALGLAMAMSRTVCGNSEDYHVPGDFNSIAEAVASAEEFDTVIVRPGTYFENVVIPHRNFTVKSEKGPEETIAQSGDSTGRPVFVVAGEHVHITGFTVQGNSGGSGIELAAAADGYITNNIISGNKYGIYLNSRSNVNVIANNTIGNNSKGGVVIADALNNLLMDNLVSDNGVGIILLGNSDSNNDRAMCSGNTIRYNQLVKNQAGMAVLHASGNFIYLNDFAENNLAALVSRGGLNTWHTPDKRGYTFDGRPHTNYLGNFWSDYRGTDADDDGVGDSPYQIDVDKDGRPLIKSTHEMGPFLYMEWSAKYEELACVAAIDINRDGVQDFIAATRDELCSYVFDGRTYSPVWKKKGAGGTIAVGDLTGDGAPEVVLGDRVITVLDGYTYNVIWESQKHETRVASVQLADVDGDGRVDIVAGTADTGVLKEARVYVYDWASRELEWKSDDLCGGITLEVGDVNGDGRKKVVCGTRNGYVYVFDGETHRQEWRSTHLGGYIRGLALADIDGEGDKEIIISNGEGRVYVFDGKTRTEKRRWSQPMTGWYSGLCVADVDSDGADELVLGLMAGERLPAHGAGLIYVLDIASFAIKQQSEILVPWVGLGEIVVADINGDGQKEILTMGRDQIYIFTR